jgi:Domain of Unknown Function with PDB structure (DUF3857)
MKRKIIIPLLFFFTTASVAQKNISPFGKIDKADLLMTDCEFDKGAVALKLIDWGNSYYTRGTNGGSVFKTVFECRTRIKILKQKGISFADVKIPYYNNDEKIISFSAYTYNINEQGNVITTAVKKNAVYYKKINTNYSQAVISFPDVKTGSVIEYRYKMERETMGQLRDWFFQERIPVRYSEYQLTIPQIFRFSVQPSVIGPMEQKQKVIDEIIAANNGLVKTKSLKSSYVMRNLPGIKDEPFMGSAKDYMQRLEFQLAQIDYGNNNITDLSFTWGNVIEELMNNEDFGLQLEETIGGAAPLTEQAKTISDEEERMKFIYNSIREHVNWNDVENIYTSHGIAKTWETKNGNAADINLLLVKMLNDGGIKSSPILFSTRDNGLLNTYYPFVSQFNTVMAFTTIGNKNFVLDATDKICSYQLVPEKIANTMGFIAAGDSGRWKDFLPGKYKMTAAVNGEIDSTGIMRAGGLVNSSGYARKKRCQSWQKNKDAFKEEYFSSPAGNLKIEKITVNNADTDWLPLEQKVKFSLKLNSADDYLYFNTNLFSGLESNPFTAAERFADIDFGFKQEYTIFGSYTIPQGYTFDELPEDIYMIMPDTSIVFNRAIQAQENLLSVKITVDFKRSFYFAADYPDFKEFYKKMFAKLNEQVVIKKKS